MRIQTIINKIDQTNSQLKNLENELLLLQNECVHAYIELGSYKQCEKCEKAQPLYY